MNIVNMYFALSGQQQPYFYNSEKNIREINTYKRRETSK
jgi:hypothetical protein